MSKVEGLEPLTRELPGFKVAMASMDGDQANVELGSEDAGSIERAIVELESVDGGELGAFR